MSFFKIFSRLKLMIPKGSWIKTASNYKIDNKILHATLYNCNGKLKPNSIAIYNDVDYHNINGQFCISGINNTIFVCLGNQLGNCLRILSSASILAKYFNKNLFIDYDFPSLMNKEKIIIKDLFPHLCLTGCSQFYDKINYTDCVSYDAYNSTNYHLIDEGRLLELPNSNNFSIIETIYSVLPSNMNYYEYNREKIDFYNSIQYPTFLTNQVTEFCNKYNIFNFIGFHIRYTDNLNDTNKQRYNTSKETFYDKLKQYTNETIFLCSDNNDIINECKNLFPNIITPDNCSNFVFQALYEMILLSKTKLIIGSNSSTFSYEAAYMSSGTDIELFENGQWNLYSLKCNS